MTPDDRDTDREGGDDRVVGDDSDVGDRLARWLADARADEDVAARVRVRHLVDQAAEEGTLSAALLDLAERSASVRIDTNSGRSFHGVVSGLGRDFVVVAGDGVAAFVVAGAIASIRTTDPSARPPAEARAPTRGGSFVGVLGDLAAARRRVGLVAIDGRAETVTGTLAAVGTDVVTLRTDAAPTLTVYVALSSLAAVLLPSG